MNIKIGAAAAAAAMLSTGAPAIAPGSAIDSGRFSITVSGFVPVICRASVGATMVPTTPGAVDLGGLREFCNSPNGYEVYADYAPSLSAASLVVDGQKVNLSKAGSTRISKENRANFTDRSIQLDTTKSGAENASMSFRIVPL